MANWFYRCKHSKSNLFILGTIRDNLAVKTAICIWGYGYNNWKTEKEMAGNPHIEWSPYCFSSSLLSVD
jgi:hypothetical protein